jgi:hypothetical protein
MLPLRGEMQDSSAPEGTDFNFVVSDGSSKDESVHFKMIGKSPQNLIQDASTTPFPVISIAGLIRGVFGWEGIPRGGGAEFPQYAFKDTAE